MTMGRTLACAIGLLGMANFGTAADWPQWRGPNRDDISLEKGLLKTWPSGGPKLVWEFKEAGTGYGCPSISKGFIYLMGSEDGKEGSKEFAVCLSEKTGKQVWRHELKTSEGKYSFGWGAGPRGTPTVDGDHLYVLGAKGDLECLATKDGSQVWKKNLVKDFEGKIPGWGYSESVLIDGDHLIATPGGKKGALVSLNKKTGALNWACKELTDGAGYSSVIIAEVDGVKQYIQQSADSGFGIRAKDGKLLWREANLARKTAVIPSPVYHDHHVFFTAGYGAGCELLKLSKDGPDGTKAEKVYVSKKFSNHHGGVVLVGDRIYGHNNGQGWACLDYLKDEDPVWLEKKGLDKGCLTYADGNFYCYGEGKGTCLMIEANPTAWTEKARMELPEKSKTPRGQGLFWAHPVVSNGKLYLRDYELLFCFDVSAPN